MKYQFVLFLASMLLSACALPPQHITQERWLQLGEDYVTEGGHTKDGYAFRLVVPRVLHTEAWLHSLQTSYKPGEGHIPIWYVFHTGGLLRTQEIGFIRTSFMRESLNDGATAFATQDQLLARVDRREREIYDPASKTPLHPDYRMSSVVSRDPKISVLRLGESSWARSTFTQLLTRYKDTSGFYIGPSETKQLLSGALYTTIAGPEYTLMVSYMVDTSRLPQGLTIESFDQFVQQYITRVKVTQFKR